VATTGGIGASCHQQILPARILRMPSGQLIQTHSPDDFSGLIIKGLRAETDIGGTGGKKGFPFGVVAIEVGRVRRFKRNLLPAGSRSGYRGWGLVT